ncbi:MAG: hypothetical protein ACR2O2_01625 [Ruegeria sp.]
MTLKYQHKKTGEEYEPKMYEGGYRVMIELASLEDFRRFSKIAHSARLKKIGSQQDNVVAFAELEEVQ